MGYSVTAGLTQTNVNTIATTVAPKYKACLHSSGSFDGLKVIVGNDGPMQEFTTTSGAGAGTKTTALATAQVQCVIAKRTALRGRKYRGRIFVGDVREDHINDGGGMDSSELAIYNDLANTLNSALGLGAIIGATYLLHGDSTAPTALVSLAADTFVGTLRRRYKRT